MKLSQLHPNEGQIAGVPKNPRYITEKDFKALKKSLAGFRKMLALRPIVIDEDFNILGGNMRYRALVKLAEEHAKVGAFEFTDEIPDEWIKQDCTLTEKEKREFVLKDNDEKGDWDMDLIANEWDTQEVADWELDLPSFETNEEPEVLDDTPEEKPFYAKLLFVNPNDCNRFVSDMKSDIESKYNCTISLSGGGL